jgi:hypothetical protein
MKKISMFLTTLFFLLMAVPSFADDSNQNNRAYEQAQRRIEQYNAKLQKEYEKAMREFEARRRADKRKTEQQDANFQREYEKAMREYNVKVRANQSILRKVERQYPGIKLDAAKAVKKNSTENIPKNESSANENTSRTRKYKRNTSQADSPRMKRLQRAKQRQRSFTTKHISKSQSTFQGKKPSENANVSNPSNRDQKRKELNRSNRAVERNNARLQRQYEQQKRQYEKNRHEYEKQRAKVEKQNAKIRKRNEEIRQNNAEQEARAKAQQQNRRAICRSCDRKPYLDHIKDNPNLPSHQRDPRVRQKYHRPPPRRR